jgi:hypothetical protein
MDPISAILGGVGIAMQIGGAMKQASISANINQTQEDILQQEQAENDVRQQAVAMMYQRKQIQNVREAQMAGARSRAAAVQGGAQFGSGAKAGQEMAQAGAAYNQETIGQDFQSANQMFSIDRGINNLKMTLGSLGTQMSSAQEISSIGGGILGAAKGLGNLSGSMGGWGGGGDMSSMGSGK